MTIDEFLIDDLGDDLLFVPSYHRFWVHMVLDCMDMIGNETEADLDRLCSVIRRLYFFDLVSVASLNSICSAIRPHTGNFAWKDNSVLGLKYLCLNALTASRRMERLSSSFTMDDWLYEWKYGIVTAFQIINLDEKKDRSLIERIQQGLSKYVPAELSYF